MFQLSSVSTTIASKHLQGLPKILPVLTREKGNAYSIFDLTKLFDVVFEALGCSKLIGLKSGFSLFPTASITPHKLFRDISETSTNPMEINIMLFQEKVLIRPI